MGAPIYVTTTPAFEIRDRRDEKVVFIRYSPRSDEPERAMSLAIFRETVAAAVRVLEEHDGPDRIVPFPGLKRSRRGGRKPQGGAP